MKRQIILQLLQWNLKEIIKELDNIKNQGFDCIQISPIQHCKSNNEWWALYQPLGFRIGNNVVGKNDLIELCKLANEKNIKIIADVVINHVASSESNSLKPHELVDKELTNNKEIWRSPISVTNWDDRDDVINHCYGLPCFKLENKYIQEKIFNFLDELVDCQISGFRIDSAKSIKLPCEDSDFFIEFNKRYGHLFNYAEVLFTSKNIIDEYSKYINVLTDSQGSDKSKLITYVESHDTYLGIGITKKLNDNDLLREWRVLLQNKEWNVMFYSRPFSDLWKSKEIKNINFK